MPAARFNDPSFRFLTGSERLSIISLTGMYRCAAIDMCGAKTRSVLGSLDSLTVGSGADLHTALQLQTLTTSLGITCTRMGDDRVRRVELASLVQRQRRGGGRGSRRHGLFRRPRLFVCEVCIILRQTTVSCTHIDSSYMEQIQGRPTITRYRGVDGIVRRCSSHAFFFLFFDNTPAFHGALPGQRMPPLGFRLSTPCQDGVI